MSRIYEQLSAEERGVVMAMKVRGESTRAIARALSRAPGSINREPKQSASTPAIVFGSHAAKLSVWT